MLKAGDIGQRNRWQWLEYMATEYNNATQQG
jgi:hypothetical protein